ncbi:hypothetical protein Hdeb2414_s0423g00890071 [Helianthus debilis subsp. tardiflorus]
MRRRLCDREEQRFKIRIDLMKMREDVAFFRFYLTSLGEFPFLLLVLFPFFSLDIPAVMVKKAIMN